ncbi:MAG: hypothetical protein BMS9Abin05_0985 [Rhodothermia bacterium]|nr:MAG: hypothetical protein BMS9Abin05_0985 [Rhodothermia bacterium]
MEDSRRQRLIELGAEELADVLGNLALQNEDVARTVARLTSSGQENAKRFTRALGDLKRRNKFYGSRESFELARQLTGILADLTAARLEPRSGVQAMVDFYRADTRIFESCDDSFGNVSDVFCHDAVDVFASYASECTDEDWIVEVVIELNQRDDYCVRLSLLERSADYLSESGLQDLIMRLWNLVGDDPDAPGAYQWLGAIERIARQMKDAALFEKARRALKSDLSIIDCEEIAKLYHESGDSETALYWLQFHPEAPSLIAGSRRWLLVDIHRKLGNLEAMAEAAREIFQSHRSEDAFEVLIEALGENQRAQVIDDETRKILQTETFSISDAGFLANVGRTDEAGKYVLARAAQIDGNYYSSLKPLAERMDKSGRPLASSMIYRALLNSILERGQSKYYHHGIGYLKKLDRLAKAVSNWRDFAPHRGYVAGLRGEHGRKRSFWSRYAG